MGHLKRGSGHLLRTSTGHLTKACAVVLDDCRCWNESDTEVDFPDIKFTVSGSSPTPLSYDNGIGSTCTAPASCPDISGDYVLSCPTFRPGSGFGGSGSTYVYLAWFTQFVCTVGSNDVYYYTIIGGYYDNATGSYLVKLGISSGVSLRSTGTGPPPAPTGTFPNNDGFPGGYSSFVETTYQFSDWPSGAPYCPSTLGSPSYNSGSTGKNSCNVSGFTPTAVIL